MRDDVGTTGNGVEVGWNSAWPEGLRQALREAAEQYHLTTFEARLVELEALGPDGHRLAARLRGMALRLEMEAVTDALA